jgi:phage gp36-like protein
VSYATQADLIARFGAEELVELTDRAEAQTIDANAVTAALADADATIDGYLAGRYAVPVVPVPPLLLRLAADITRYLLHGKAAPDTVRRAYDDALKLLRDLSSGSAVLTGVAAPAPGASPAAPPATADFVAPDRVMTGGTLADYLG